MQINLEIDYYTQLAVSLSKHRDCLKTNVIVDAK